MTVILSHLSLQCFVNQHYCSTIPQTSTSTHKKVSIVTNTIMRQIPWHCPFAAAAFVGRQRAPRQPKCLKETFEKRKTQRRGLFSPDRFGGPAQKVIAIKWRKPSLMEKKHTAYTLCTFTWNFLFKIAVSKDPSRLEWHDQFNNSCLPKDGIKIQMLSFIRVLDFQHCWLFSAKPQLPTLLTS